jgi:ADP-ribosylglycohydrolase
MTPPDKRARFRGCLLGGAVGDALGAPVEFLSRDAILDRFGPDGISTFAPAYGRLGAVTDDTQMSLFTAEGLIRSWVRGTLKGITTEVGVTSRAYLRWLKTQSERPRHHIDRWDEEPGWLFQQRDLHHRRAPGNTCLSALRDMQFLGDSPARNNSKGCGAVMRMAPAGLFVASIVRRVDADAAFELGSDLSAITHGHPTGALAGGAFAVLILELARGTTLSEALVTATSSLAERPHHEETLRALESARLLADQDVDHPSAILQLGQGWVAEEALAISVYCALVANDFKHGVMLAVNHAGDSDSTGSITGNLLGATHGVDVIPAEWLHELELRDVIEEMADDLCDFPTWEISDYDSEEGGLTDRIWRKYPGC